MEATTDEMLARQRATINAARGPIRTLRCACCGESCKGRQWHNRDTGCGLCPACIEYTSERETADEHRSCYGVRGVHYDLQDGAA